MHGNHWYFDMVLHVHLPFRVFLSFPRIINLRYR